MLNACDVKDLYHRMIEYNNAVEAYGPILSSYIMYAKVCTIILAVPVFTGHDI